MLKDWINEARPRTLLLGLTNCALGCGLGFYYGEVNCYTAVTACLIVLTGVLLQVLCNFANDYGDAYKNADGVNRLGPIRAVMSGAISIAQLRRGMAVVTMMSSVTGIVAVGMAVGGNLQVLSWFVFLGVIAILAALFYTIGMAYGYKGLGDVAVFFFFGLVAVVGSQILITAAGDSGLDIYPDTMLLAVSVGAGSVMVLHVSGMRDIIEDRENGKRTMAARLGYKLASVYLGALFMVVALTSFAACIMSHKFWECGLILVALLPLLASTVRTIKYASDGAKIAPELKYTSMGVGIHNVFWLIVLTVDYWVYC